MVQYAGAQAGYTPAQDTDHVFSADTPGLVPAGGDLTKFLRGDGAWAAVGAGSAAWGAISGVLADQADLQAVLAGKAASSHTHAQSDVTNLVADLAGKAPATHSHVIGDVTSLQSSLDGKAASSHAHAQADVTDLTTDLAGKEPAQTAVSQVEAETGTGVSVRSWTPQRVNQAIQALAPAGGGGFPSTFVRKTADEQNTSNTVLIDAAGLGFTLAADKVYLVRWIIWYTSAATTTGITLAVNGPAAPAAVRCSAMTDPTSAGNAQSIPGQGAVDTYDEVMTFGGVLNTTSLRQAVMECLVRNGANTGTLIPRFRSEISGSAITIKAESYGMMSEVA